MRRRCDLITKTEVEELRGFIADTLGEMFGGRGLAFEAPIIETKIDQYDDEYLEFTIVFDGDERKFDLEGDLEMRDRVKDKLYDMGFEGIPSFTIQLKSEREELLKEGPWWMQTS